MRSSPQKATRSASDLATRGARMCCSWAFLKTTGFMCPKGGAGRWAPASRWTLETKMENRSHDSSPRASFVSTGRDPFLCESAGGFLFGGKRV